MGKKDTNIPIFKNKEFLYSHTYTLRQANKLFLFAHWIFYFYSEFVVVGVVRKGKNALKKLEEEERSPGGREPAQG